MSRVAEILSSAQAYELKHEDGESVGLEVANPLSPSDIEEAAGRYRINIPEQLRDLLMFASGLSLFGLEIMSCGQQQYYAQQGLISFHNWGNGDFDCITTPASRYPEGSIVFMNHNPDVTVLIETDLAAWLVRAIDEIRANGALYHPRDYMAQLVSVGGLYEGVVKALDGVDCELNS